MKLTKQQTELIVKIVGIVLIVAAIAGAVSLAATFAEDDSGYKTYIPTYKVGSIDLTTGECVSDDETAIYTEKAIECTGIKLYADFDSDIDYAVHVYDENDKWLGCVENEGLNLTVEGPFDGTNFEGAHAVRIVIYPQSDENGKVSLFEILTYANQLDVKITNKEFKSGTTTTE